MARVIKRIKGEDFVSFEIGKEVITVRLAEIPESMKEKLIIHGLNAKCGDAAASCKTDSERLAAISASVNNIKSGVWRETSSGGTILAEAVARVKRIDVMEAQELIDGLNDEQLAAVKAHSKVKWALNEIRSERLQASAKAAKVEDLDAILNM